MEVFGLAAWRRKQGRTLCGLLGLALGAVLVVHSLNAAELTVKDLAFACIDDDQEAILAAAEKVRPQDATALAELAAKEPRVLELPALIYLRRGDLEKAQRAYETLLAQLPTDSKAHDRFKKALESLQTQIAFENTGNSAYAKAGFTLAGELRSVVGKEGQKYWFVAWQKNECGFPSASGEAVVEVFRGLGLYALTKIGEVLGQGLTLGDKALLYEGPDRDPLVAIGSYTGGNCWACSFIRLVRISDKKLEEITLPEGSPGPIGAARDLKGDGTYAFLSTDVRWEFYGGLCHACSPSVTTIYALDGDTLVEACETYASYYEDRLKGFEAPLDPNIGSMFEAGTILSKFLNQLQIGEMAAARQTLHQGFDPFAAGSGEDADWSRKTLAELDGRLARLAKAPPRACPVLGL